MRNKRRSSLNQADRETWPWPGNYETTRNSIGFVSVLGDFFWGAFCSHGIELYHEIRLNHSLGRTCFGSHFVFQLRSSRHFVTSRGEGSVWCTLIWPLDQLVLKGLKCRPTNCCCFIYSFLFTILVRYTSTYRRTFPRERNIYSFRCETHPGCQSPQVLLYYLFYRSLKTFPG